MSVETRCSSLDVPFEALDDDVSEVVSSHVGSGRGVDTDSVSDDNAELSCAIDEKWNLDYKNQL